MRIPKGNKAPPSPAEKSSVSSTGAAAGAGSSSAVAAPAPKRRPAQPKNGCVHVLTTLVSAIPIVLFFYYSAFRSTFPVHKAGVVLVHARDDLAVAAQVSQKFIDRRFHVLLAVDKGLDSSTVSFPTGVVPFPLDASDSASIDGAMARLQATLDEVKLPFAGYVRTIGADLPLTPLMLTDASNIAASLSTDVVGSVAMVHRLMPLLVRDSGRVVLSTTHVATTGEKKEHKHTCLVNTFT